MDEKQSTPTCDKCGVEITTGLMCVFCPLGNECALYPGPESQESVDFFRDMFSQEPMNDQHR